MSDIAAVLAAHGIQRPAVTIRAAADAGLPLPAACIVLMDETAGGRSVWGHDHSTSPGYSQGLYTFGGPVLEDATREFVRRAQAGRIGLQGIGDCQLTSLGYVNRAMALGGVWDPYANQRAGFEGLARLIAAHGVQQGFQQYNGGTSGSAASVAYGRRSAAAYGTWAALIATATAAAAPAAAAPPPAAARPRPVGTDLVENIRLTGSGAEKLGLDPPGQYVIAAAWLSLIVDGPDGATASVTCNPQRPGGGTQPEHTLTAHVLTDGTHTSTRDTLGIAAGTDQIQLRWTVSPGAVAVLVPAFRAAT